MPKRILLASLLVCSVACAESRNLILNSGFESGVTHWMPLDGWIASAVYDSPLISRKPELFKDGLAGSTLPEPVSARVTEEKYEGRYSCRLDKDYEAIHSAYVQVAAAGSHTCSAWMKSTHPNTEVRMMVVSAERTGKGYGKAKFEHTEVLRVATQWKRYSFDALLVETSDGRYQVIVHLPVRRGGDSEPSARRIDLRPRSNPEKVYVDAVQLEQGGPTEYRPTSGLEIGARLVDTEDWLFAAGDTPVLEIQSGSPSVAEFRIDVTDWQGNAVWGKAIPVSQESAPAGVRVPLKLNGLGYFRTLVRAVSASGVSSRQVELPFGIIHRHPQEGDFENSPFGGMFTVTRNYGSSWFKPGYHMGWYELDERQIRSARKIGMRWVKTMDLMGFTTWAVAEPQRGVIQWGDPEVRLIRRHGFWIYGKLAYAPVFAQRQEKKFRDFHVGPPGDLAAWDRFVRQAFEHYRDDLEIRYWGVWTEPFSSSFWRGTPDDYVDLLRRTNRIAKSVDPRIVIGGVCSQSPFYKYQTRGMIDGIVRGGALHHCDAYVYHRCHDMGDRGKMSVMPEETRPSWVEDIRTFQQWMRDLGRGPMPIYNTEFRQWTTSAYLDRARFATVGYAKASERLAVDTRTSVEWVVRAQVVSMAHGVNKLFVYGVGPCGWNYDQTSWQQMKEADGRPKPWMLAYSAMAYLLGGARPAGQVQLHDRARCYLFTKPDTTVVVVWGLFTPAQGTGRLVLSPAMRTRVLDVMGDPVESRFGPRPAVPLTGTPYYLLFPTADRSAAAVTLQQGKVQWSGDSFPGQKADDET